MTRFLFALALSLVPLATPARANLIIEVTQSPAALTAGQSVDWTVAVLNQSAYPITGFQLNVGFSDWLTPTAVTEMGYFHDNGVFFFPGIASSNSITFILDSLPGNDVLPSGPNPLVTISFTATQDGTPQLDLFDPVLTLSDGSDAVIDSISFTPPVVTDAPGAGAPEPGTFVLFGGALAGLVVVWRRAARSGDGRRPLGGSAEPAMTGPQDAVFAGGISKSWRSFRRETQALNGLTLRTPRGSAFALLGPNGAGKTTFIKILIGAVKPTAGVATVFGNPAGSLQARALLGYVPESASAPLHLTPAQWIDFRGALHGLNTDCRRARATELLEEVGMGPYADRPLKNCSHGMRQRAFIAAALVQQPKMLILDEPTDGLDPAGRREVLDLLRRLNRERGVTLLISSHVLSEVEEICTEVAILSHGRLVRTGRLSDLTAGGGYTVTLAEAQPELENLLASRGIVVVRQPGELLRLNVGTRDQLDWALECARAAAARIETLARSATSLETVYLAEMQTGEETVK